MSARHLALTVSLLVGVSACSRSPWVELDGHRYRIEIANDQASRERGLMFRDQMDPDHGMLFIHQAEAPLAYWMKNTRIPLDILYFDHDLKLVSQQRNVPPCTAGDACPNYPSKAPALYVLELNAGQADQIGLKDGDKLTVAPTVNLKAKPD